MGKIVFLVERLGLLILAGADVALLHYFGGLGVSASALLGVSFTSIEIWLYALKEIAAFKPYGLVIDVNYETLWADLKLTPTDEEPKFKSVTFSASAPRSLPGLTNVLIASSWTSSLKSPVALGLGAASADQHSSCDRPTRATSSV